MSQAKSILHMFAPQKHMSPFDVNMAADAGFEVIIPYINVELDEVRALVQDAIFSRPPEYSKRTGVFIGGKDALLALDMMKAAKEALVPPFELSTFADPAGSFTTAAGMVACVEKVLKDKHGKSWNDVTVTVFGATGVVGFASAVIAAQEGAKVRMVAHRGFERVVNTSNAAKERFGVDLEPVPGETPEQKADIVEKAEVVFAAAAAGVQILSSEEIAKAKGLLVAADVNAVPPPGVAGMELQMNGEPLPGCEQALGVGPLTIGDVKYKTESGLFTRMINATEPVHLDFRDAFKLARSFVA